MSKQTAPRFKDSQKQFKTKKFSEQAKMKVDRENGILRDVVLAQVGPAEGHGTNVEQQFINELGKQGKAVEIGIKTRFGHPSGSDETLGKFTGRAHNHRVEGSQVIADIHLSKASINSPNGNLYKYLLDLAEEDPNAFGMSVVTSGNWLYQYDDEGNMYSENEDDWDNKYSSDRPLYEMFINYHNVDFVDEGALTPNGLFSVALNNDLFAVKATSFLDTNPQVSEFLKTHPEKVIEFMSKRFGFNIPLTKRKEILSLFNSKINPMEKKLFEITAETKGGIKLIITSEEKTPQVGDPIETESGEEVAGDLELTDGTILTVADGEITAITEAETEEEAEEETEHSAGKKTIDYKKKYSTLKVKFDALEQKVNEQAQEIADLKKRPKTPYSVVEKKIDTLSGGGKQPEVTEYNKKAREAYEKAKKRKKIDDDKE